MHLTNDIANAGDVEFFRFEVITHEAGDLTNEEYDFGKFISRELMEIFNSLFDLRNNEDPGEGGVVLEENPADA